MSQINEKEKFCVICNEGFEEIVSSEIREILDVDTEISDSHVLFESSLEDAILFTYRTQSSKKVLKVLSRFLAEGEDEMVEEVSKIDFSSIEGTFCVRCSSHSSERPLGSAVYERLEDPEVNLDDPDNLIFFHWPSRRTNGKYDVVAGLDMTGKDLSKRGYKIFSHPSSIKGTLAYFLVSLSGFSGDGVLLDPCSGSGTICAEAAFSATGISPRSYDKEDFFSRWVGRDKSNYIMVEHDKKTPFIPPKELKSLISSYDVDLQAMNSAKKNLKIAGLDKFVSVARGEVDWLDTKFGRGTVKYIVTNPPEYNNFNSKNNDKLYSRLFYHAEFLLSDDGKMIVLSNSKNPMEISRKYNLHPKIETSFMHGSAEKHIMSFTKQKN